MSITTSPSMATAKPAPSSRPSAKLAPKASRTGANRGGQSPSMGNSDMAGCLAPPPLSGEGQAGSVPVVVRLERPFRRDADVGRLLGLQLGQLGAQLAEVKHGH